MKISSVLALGASLLVAVAVFAADQEKPAGRQQGQHRPGGGIMEMLRGIELTADQKAKVQDLQKEIGPKMKAIQEKREAIMTDEQKKCLADAMKAARDSGKGREAFRAAMDSVKLTDEQKAKMEDVRKEQGEVQKQIHEKLQSILTPEQQEQLKKKMAEGHKPREGKAKEGDKK
jgi:Spy/CpxP family protein refolding chaperone